MGLPVAWGMAARIADRSDNVAREIQKIAEMTNHPGILDDLTEAHNRMVNVSEIDRRENGPTPTDNLSMMIEGTDTCLNCGEEIESGGWCGMKCLQEWGKTVEGGS